MQNRAGAVTRAGTEIRTQSVATYLDADSRLQTATSNEVINEVATVDGVEIIPDGGAGLEPLQYTGTPALDQVTAPGNVAYYHYSLRNTGNDDDTYTVDVGFDPAGGVNPDAIAPESVRVYHDVNGDGRVDPGDLSLRQIDSSGVQDAAVSTPLLAPAGEIALLVAVHTPVSATAADAIYCDIQAVSNGDGATDAVTNLSVTTFAVGQGVLTVVKSADTPVAAPGDTVTYTIEGTNTGGAEVYSIPDSSLEIAPIDVDGDDNVGPGDAVDGILIADDLDPTTVFVGTSDYAGIIPVAYAPSAALVLYWDQTASRWTTDKSDAMWTDTPRIGLFIPDSDSSSAPGDDSPGVVLEVGQGFRFSFSANLLPSLSDTTVTNQAVAFYSADDGPTVQIVESNTSRITVSSASRSAAAFGPYTWPKADNDSVVTIGHGTTRGDNATTTTPQHPSVTTGRDLTSGVSSDLTSAGVRDAGEAIAFPLTVLNPSESSSVTAAFNITCVTPDPGYTLVLRKTDGITPLNDTTGDGVPDTGALAPGEYADIVAVLYLSPEMDDSDGTSLTLTATCAEPDPTAGSYEIDTTTVSVTEVRAAGVDIATAGALGGDDAVQTDAVAGQADDDDQTGVGAVPGSTLVFAVDVANMRNREDAGGAVDEKTGADDTYVLSVSAVGTASTFRIDLFADTDADGVLDDSELQPVAGTGLLAPVANVDSIQADEIFHLLVRVQVPEATAAGDFFVDVTAQSTNNPDPVTGADSMRLLVRVGQAPGIELVPDNTATIAAGGSHLFRHALHNIGNVADTVTLSFSTLPDGYNAAFIDAVDGSVRGTGAAYTTDELLPGSSDDVCLRVLAPADATTGTTIPVAVTADMDSFTAEDSPMSTDTAVDVLTVTDGALKLTKSSNPAGAVPPGGTITYTTEYSNLSLDDLSSCRVSDAVPEHTTLCDANGDWSALCAVVPDGLGGIATVNAKADPGYFYYSTDNGLNWSPWTTPPDPAGVTNVRVLLGTVASGQSGEFVFQVTVD
jgi:uncharacterized repeat protein (TIGR01451 family)